MTARFPLDSAQRSELVGIVHAAALERLELLGEATRDRLALGVAEAFAQRMDSLERGE